MLCLFATFQKNILSAHVFETVVKPMLVCMLEYIFYE